MIFLIFHGGTHYKKNKLENKIFGCLKGPIFESQGVALKCLH